MHFCLKLVFSLFFVGSLNAVPYNCSGTVTINPPANLSIPYYYPSWWNTNLEAPQYSAGQNCSWIINVPKGMFAYFAVKANTTGTPVLTMTDSAGYVATIESSVLEPYYVMDPSFRVDLKNPWLIGSLGMIVQWYQVSPIIKPMTVKVSANSSPLPLFTGDFDNSTVITADSRVSFLVFPPATLDFMPYLRMTQVYDGPSTASTRVGNLYQFMASGQNFVSTGNSVTLFTVFPGFKLGNAIVFQDYNDVKQFKTYRVISCILPSTCQTTLDASQGTAAAIRYYPTPSFFVKSLQMSNTNKLSVYTDYVTDSHRLAVYNQTTAKTNMPQKFSGKFTTFVLDQSMATITYASNALDAGWTTGFEGRRGFFMSPNYGVSSIDQSFSDQIYSAQSATADISYFVDGTSFVAGTELNVNILSKQRSVLNQTYTASVLMGGSVVASGDQIVVKYDQNSKVSRGTFVNFRFDKHNSAAINGVFVTLFVSIWIALTH